MWTKQRAAELLADGYWFSALPPDLQQEIIANSEIVQKRRHTLLYRIGDPVDGMYAALEGDLRAYVYDDQDRPIFLRSFGPKTWFGDLHLHEGQDRRTFEVRAVSPCALLFLPARGYEVITADRQAYQHFVKLLCINVRFLTRVAVEARSDAPRRAARALLRLARSQGVVVANGVQLRVRISQSDLASLVGVTRQYINSLLTRWNKEGVVVWKGTSRPILDVTKLQALLSPLDDWMPEPEITFSRRDEKSASISN